VKTSAKGLAFIRSKEKRVLTVYLDGGGVPTGGYGHTGPDLPPVGTSLSDEQIEGWFRGDVAEAEAEVNRLAGDLPLTQGMFDALVSFEFNTGGLEFHVQGKPHASKVLRALRERRWCDAVEELVPWNNDAGEARRGLLIRRLEEGLMFAGQRFPA
jgi:GH24 family phage-related lysozyme (muramidase)